MNDFRVDQCRLMGFDLSEKLVALLAQRPIALGHRRLECHDFLDHGLIFDSQPMSLGVGRVESKIALSKLLDVPIELASNGFEFHATLFQLGGQFNMLGEESFVLFLQPAGTLHVEMLDRPRRRSLSNRFIRFRLKIVVRPEQENVLALLALDIFAEMHPADTQGRLAISTNRNDSIGTN